MFYNINVVMRVFIGKGELRIKNDTNVINKYHYVRKFENKFFYDIFVGFVVKVYIL